MSFDLDAFTAGEGIAVGDECLDPPHSSSRRQAIPLQAAVGFLRDGAFDEIKVSPDRKPPLIHPPRQRQMCVSRLFHHLSPRRAGAQRSRER